MANVVLTYKRVDVDLSTGWLIHDETARTVEFEKLPFTQMMSRFAEMLCAYPEAGGVILRNDRPGLKPFVLDQTTVDLLRVDPAAAIRSMTYTPPAPGTEERRAPPPSGLIVGHDTLADGFGDKLYCRVRIPGKKGSSADIECPGCGRWQRGYTPFVCNHCGLVQYMRVVSPRWAEVPVESLLRLPHTRFFFPRGWNKGHNWVPREELIARFEAYKKEKEQACSPPRR